MYAKLFKRVIDCVLSLAALIVLSPVLLILTVIGVFAMGGNPFFIQQRPGKIDRKTGKEKLFRLVKFRSMNNKKDQEGKILPDEVRLTKYGRILRGTSLDELPELWNILKGDMSIVGPRPLAVQYLPYYSEEERLRHSVRPGLTGWAQVNGRTSIDWDTRFQYDLDYVRNITFWRDMYIILLTVKKIFARDEVVGAEEQGDFDEYRRNQYEKLNQEWG